MSAEPPHSNGEGGLKHTGGTIDYLSINMASSVNTCCLFFVTDIFQYVQQQFSLCIFERLQDESCLLPF